MWNTEASVWIATSEDVEGLVLESGSVDALIAELVIAEWIETAQLLGREVPLPKGRLHYA